MGSACVNADNTFNNQRFATNRGWNGVWMLWKVKMIKKTKSLPELWREARYKRNAMMAGIDSTDYDVLFHHYSQKWCCIFSLPSKL